MYMSGEERVGKKYISVFLYMSPTIVPEVLHKQHKPGKFLQKSIKVSKTSANKFDDSRIRKPEIVRRNFKLKLLKQKEKIYF